MGPHFFTLNAVISGFLHSGADWRAAVQNLREMHGYGEEYDEAAAKIQRHGEIFERMKPVAGLVQRRATPPTIERKAS